MPTLWYGVFSGLFRRSGRYGGEVTGEDGLIGKWADYALCGKVIIAPAHTFGDLKALAHRLYSGESVASHSRAAIQDLIIEDLFMMPVGEGANPWTGGRE